MQPNQSYTSELAEPSTVTGQRSLDTRRSTEFDDRDSNQTPVDFDAIDAEVESIDQLLAEYERSRDGAEAQTDQTVSHKATHSVLSVVIPVYNEPDTVLQIVDRVRQLPISKQVVVVNDGSTDATPNALRQLDGLEDVLIVHHEVNRGKGAALQTGFQHVTGNIVIVQDADLEYDPRDIMKVIEPLLADECDVVYGSRYLDNPQQDPSRLHRFGNRLLTDLSNRTTGFRLTDMETCYKAFRREVLESICIEQSRFGFEPEITAKLAKQGVAIREVGVRYACRSKLDGKKIGVRDLFNAVYCIVRYRF